VWVARELLRLLERVAAGVAIAAVVAAVWSLTQHGSTAHRFQIAFIVIGAIVVALGALGRGSSYQRETDLQTRWGLRGVSALLPRADPTEPQLAPGAVLFVSGAIVIALGLLI
jgi:hypothetical protein